MTTIFTLPDEVIAQIAAGEVIERPAYVIKELIDNALDAQATQISVEISGTDFERMSLRDDGVGMSREDMKLASLLHTTSKIRTVDDLSTISSLGFRGEALASIAAVSTLTIYSRRRDDEIGTVYSSIDDSLHDAGMPVGTRVVVEQLFSQMPARKQFLKSMKTERRLIVDIVTTYALAHPHIHFRLMLNGKMIFDRHSESLLERYVSLYDDHSASELLPLTIDDSYAQVTGFLSKPNNSFLSTREQYLIVNHRPIVDRLLSSAIKEAYGTLLPRDQFPRALLLFTIPVQLIDVNVHPRKEQIAFTNPDHIFLTVKTAIQEMLGQHNLTFQTSGWGILSKKTEKYLSITNSVVGKVLKEAVLPEVENLDFFDWKTLMQWHSTYISVQTNSGILLFDQHAAHERILFEQFINEYSHQKKKSSSVTLAHAIDFPLSQSGKLLIEEYLEYFEKMGFLLEKKHAGFQITMVPALFVDRDPRSILTEAIVDIQAGLPIRSVDSLTHKLLTYLACRSAVKAGDILSTQQMQDIIEKLFSTKDKYTCPHGRPTMIEMKKKDLDILFKRV